MYFSLDGKWKINHVPFKSDITEMLQEDFVPEGWLSADVPAQVHAVLQKHGFIRGHVYHKEEYEDQWIEEKDWIYFKEFVVPENLCGKKVELCCKGLDTFCEVYLNGTLLGKSENMFRTFRADIGDVLKTGDRNVLVIRFYSPTEYVKEMDQKGIFSITTSREMCRLCCNRTEGRTCFCKSYRS